jgi:peptidyl-prolyl cis-trans isomerase B (cyclophilin B)
VAVLVAAGIVWLAVGGSDDRPRTPAAASSTAPSAAGRTCDWSVVPANARPREMTEVVAPPAGPVADTGTAVMTITTNRGPIRVAVDRSRTPCAVASFAHLGARGFFADTACHRLLDQGLLALQCGDPSGTNWGGPPYRFADENLPVGRRPAYAKGVVAVANAGENTNNSQLFLVYGDSEIPPTFPVLGRVTEGLDILEQVAAGGHDGTFARSPDGAPGPGGGRPKQPLTILSLTVA